MNLEFRNFPTLRGPFSNPSHFPLHPFVNIQRIRSVYVHMDVGTSKTFSSYSNFLILRFIKHFPEFPFTDSSNLILIPNIHSLLFLFSRPFLYRKVSPSLPNLYEYIVYTVYQTILQPRLLALCPSHSLPDPSPSPTYRNPR